MPKKATHFVGVLLLLTSTILLSGTLYASNTSVAVFATTERIETVKVKTQLIPYSSEDYQIPDGTTLNFSSAGEICPIDNRCSGEFGGWLVALYLEDEELYGAEISGIVEFNETHHTQIDSYTLNWTQMPLHGRLEIVDTQNDTAQNKTMYQLRGSITMEESPIGLYFNYPITNGTLDLTSGILAFEGQRTLKAQQ